MQPSNRVGPYELIRPLGAGGMAETFVAVRRGPEGFEQRVCLKRILQGHTAEPAFVELFLDEARLLAQLRCAGIVQVYDFGAADDTYYMALELIDGADLDSLIDGMLRREMRLPTDLSLYIATQLLVALDYAHSVVIDGQPLNIVHRDISPSNILLSLHGEVKLTDFGIAKSRGRKHKTQTGHTKGKVAYMSPEQVRGEELDGRSDLFAVGVLLYEMLTGTHPFYAPTDLTLLNNILGGRRRPVTDFLIEPPAGLVTLVDALLEVDAAKRPQSAAEALRMLPAQPQAFLLQRKLATLMTEHRTWNDKQRAEAKAANKITPSDGVTTVLPRGRTPADRLAAVPTQDLSVRPTGTSSGALPAAARNTASDVDSLGRGRSSKGRWLSAAGLGIVLAGAAVWSLRVEEAPPVVQKVTPPAEPSPSVPKSLPAANPQPTPEPTLDPPSPAQALEAGTLTPPGTDADGKATTPPKPSKPDSSKPARGSKGRTNPARAVVATPVEPEPPPVVNRQTPRSGAQVKTDDF